MRLGSILLPKTTLLFSCITTLRAPTSPSALSECPVQTKRDAIGRNPRNTQPPKQLWNRDLNFAILLRAFVDRVEDRLDRDTVVAGT